MADFTKSSQGSATGHRVGQAKPLVSDRGVFTAAIFVLAMTLLVILINGARNQIRDLNRETVQAANHPSVQMNVAVCSGVDEDIQFASGEKQKIVHIEQSCWSAWVVTPPTSDWRIGPPLNQTTEALFIDGSRVTIRSGRSTYVGVRRGIFRLMGAGPAIVTISFAR